MPALSLMFLVVLALLVLVIWLIRRAPDPYAGLGMLDQQDQATRDAGGTQ